MSSLAALGGKSNVVMCVGKNDLSQSIQVKFFVQDTSLDVIETFVIIGSQILCYVCASQISQPALFVL